jgi:hypothetical protein
MQKLGLGGGEEQPARVAAASANAFGALLAELQQVNRRRGLDRTLAVGELILREFFGGEPRAWREQSRKKANSIRRLALRQDCPFRKSTLNEAVGVYVAVLEQPGLRDASHVTASHIASVLRLPPEERARLLDEAERERWSVRQLRARVRSRARAGAGESRLTSLDAGMRAVLLLQRSLEDAVAIAGHMGELGPLSSHSRSELRELANEVLRLGTQLSNLAADPADGARFRPSEIRYREGQEHEGFPSSDAAPTSR